MNADDHMRDSGPNGSALANMLAGRYDRAERLYRALLLQKPSDQVRLELGCALVALGRTEEALSILGKVDASNGDLIIKARYEAVLGLLAVQQTDTEGTVQHLATSIKLDPEFPLAPLWLGRHWLWAKRDTETARAYFQLARTLAPDSVGPVMNEVALEVETRNFAMAAALSQTLGGRSPRGVRPWLVRAGAWLLNTPYEGRLIFLVSCLLFLLPYAWALVYIMWFVYAIASFLSLRRLSPRLAFVPVVYWFGVTCVALIRLVILRRLLP